MGRREEPEEMLHWQQHEIDRCSGKALAGIFVSYFYLMLRLRSPASLRYYPGIQPDVRRPTAAESQLMAVDIHSPTGVSAATRRPTSGPTTRRFTEAISSLFSFID